MNNHALTPVISGRPKGRVQTAITLIANYTEIFLTPATMHIVQSLDFHSKFKLCNLDFEKISLFKGELKFDEKQRQIL